MTQSYNEEALARDLADKFPETTMVFWREAVDAIENIIIDTVNSDVKVKLAKFGIFTKAHRKAREGRNPSTGEAIQISARNAVKFSASTSFKKALNK